MKKLLLATAVLAVVGFYFVSPRNAQGAEWKPLAPSYCTQLELEMELYSNAWLQASDSEKACYACIDSNGTDAVNCASAPPDRNGSCLEYTRAKIDYQNRAWHAYFEWLSKNCGRYL